MWLSAGFKGPNLSDIILSIDPLFIAASKGFAILTEFYEDAAKALFFRQVKWRKWVLRQQICVNKFQLCHLLDSSSRTLFYAELDNTEFPKLNCNTFYF